MSEPNLIQVRTVSDILILTTLYLLGFKKKTAIQICSKPSLQFKIINAYKIILDVLRMCKALYGCRLFI